MAQSKSQPDALLAALITQSAWLTAGHLQGCHLGSEQAEVPVPWCAWDHGSDGGRRAKPGLHAAGRLFHFMVMINIALFLPAVVDKNGNLVASSLTAKPLYNYAMKVRAPAWHCVWPTGSRQRASHAGTKHTLPPWPATAHPSHAFSFCRRLSLSTRLRVGVLFGCLINARGLHGRGLHCEMQ